MVDNEKQTTRPTGSSRTDTQRIYIIAVLTWALLWLVDSAVEVWAYNPDQRTFWQVLIGDVGPHTLFMRLLYLLVSLMIAALVARVLRQRSILQGFLLHQNQVLASIRNVNQLITHEHDRNKLLDQTCHLLVENRGFYNVWIALVEHGQPVEPFFHAGFGKKFAPLAERLKSGMIPDCAKQAIQSRTVQVVANPPNQCEDCPLSSSYANRAGLTVALEHDQRIYGWLCVSVPYEYASDQQEHELMTELAGDLAHALWSLEVDAQRQQSYEDLYRFRHILSTINNPISLVSRDYRYIAVNEAYGEIFSVDWQSIPGRSVAELCGEEVFQQQIKPHIDAALDGTEIRYEIHTEYPGIGLRWMEMRYVPFRDENGSITGVVSHGFDITDRKQSELELEESEERFQRMLGVVPDMISIHDREMNILYSNWNGFGNVPPEKRVLHTKCYHTYRGYDDVCPDCHAKRVLLTREPYQSEVQLDENLWVDIRVIPLLNEQGKIDFFMEWVRDISDSKQTELALKESEQRYRMLLEHSSDILVIIDQDGFQRYISQSAERITGFTVEELQRSFLEVIHPDDRARVQALFMQFRNIPGKTVQVEYRHIHKNGDWRYFETIARNCLDDPEIQGIVSNVRDVTDRKRVELALEQVSVRFEGILHHSPLLISEFDLEGRYLLTNQATCDLLQITERDIVGKLFDDLLPAEKAQVFHQRIREVAESKDLLVVEDELTIGEGTLYFSTVLFPLFDQDDNVVSVAGIAMDITERKEIEQERLKLEEQYRQAQKMEAIGQLTGGVAHDFNNLLQVINVSAELVIERLADRPHELDLLKEVAHAGQRAANLVKQLLMFSRKQIMRPEKLDLNEVVANLLKMVGRVIGEHIRVTWSPCSRPVLILADRGMIEQALMNLCVNARDAMPEGGNLTIETNQIEIDDEFVVNNSWAESGTYAVLSVGDTGCGMSAEVLAHIFEPFFTTKEVGQGTGLGLSTVYGIVRQHDGMTRVYSEIGQGTEFKLYLPLAQDQSKPDNAINEDNLPVPGGKETILVAEDEAAVRRLVEFTLHNAGYRVLLANDGLDAVKVFREHQSEIDLVLLDVVMPNLSGPKALEQMKELKPNIKSVFSSGYSEETVHNNYVQQNKVILISKPYISRELLSTIRRVLDT